MSAPIPNTCPLIDEVIDTIRDQIKSLKSAYKDLDDENYVDACSTIEDVISTMEGMLPNRYHSYLDKNLVIEKIRTANEELRSWGEGKEEELIEVEENREELFEENQRLTNEVEKLKMLIADMNTTTE